MTILSSVKAGLAVLALVGVSACGNANKDLSNLIKDLPKAVFAKKAPPPVVTPELANAALAATPAAISLVALEATKGQSLMQDLQRNGPYQTFGTSDRRVIVMRSGMITSTRGLGGDLMSSDEGALLSAIRSGASVQYVQRHLTPEDVTETTTYICHIGAGSRDAVLAPLGMPNGRAVKATCTAGEDYFVNTYIVSSDGYILAGRQFVSKTLGYIQTQAVRR